MKTADSKLRELAEKFLFEKYPNIGGRLELLVPILADFASSPEIHTDCESGTPSNSAKETKI